MNCLTLRTNDPFINLATEEYLLKNSDGEFLILYSDSPSVIIGKHQSPHRESDTEYVIKHDIPVIRRLSGGGTVYHDEGNLNFTFIRNSKPGHQVDFRKYTRPVIEFLSVYGVDARLEGKNDLKVNGLKISGNAEHVHRNRVMHHGTLLFDTDLSALRNSLRKDTSAYITRAVNSNPSSVANLKQFMPGFSSPDQFRRKMEEYFLNLPGNQTYSLKEEEIEVIETLADAKYRTWVWNYAYGPDYQLIKQIEYKSVKVRIELDVSNAVIRKCNLFGSELLSRFASGLTGIRHMPEDIEFRLEEYRISDLEVFHLF